MVETLNRISRVNRTLVNEMGREPTPEELAKKTGVPARKVRLILESSRKPLSLETPIGEDSELGDFLEDKSAESPNDTPDQPGPDESGRARARHALAQGEGDPAPALRHRRRGRAHARGSRQALLGDPRADPPDRDQGAPQAPPPAARPGAQGLRRELISPTRRPRNTPRAAGAAVTHRHSRAIGLGQPPVPVPHQPHRRRHQQSAHHGGIEDDGDADPDADRLDDHRVGESKGEEDGRHDGPRPRDEPSGPLETRADRQARCFPCARTPRALG